MGAFLDMLIIMSDGFSRVKTDYKHLFWVFRISVFAYLFRYLPEALKLQPLGKLL